MAGKVGLPHDKPSGAAGKTPLQWKVSGYGSSPSAIRNEPNLVFPWRLGRFQAVALLLRPRAMFPSPRTRMILPLQVLLISKGDAIPFHRALEAGRFHAKITQVSSLEDFDDALEDEDFDWDIVIADSEVLSIPDVMAAVEAEQPDLPIFVIIQPGDTTQYDDISGSLPADDLPNLGAVVERFLTYAQPARWNFGQRQFHPGNETPGTSDETSYRAISELATDFALAIHRDRDGPDQIVWSTGAFERVTGYSVDEIDALDGLVALVRADHRVQARAALSTLFDDGASLIELPIITKSGEEKWVRSRLMVAREVDSDITVIYCCGEDVTALKLAEAELIAARERAEETARLKSAFLANMSHEIRTPLTAVLGFASLLAAEAEGEAREFAQYVEQSGRRLLDTLDSVLDLSRIDGDGVELALDVVDVTAEARQVLELLGPAAEEKGIALQLSAADEPVRALVDKACLGRVLTNLIGNGVKFTEDGEVRVVLCAEGDAVRLEIRDTGIGIDPEFVPYLFDEFRQESVRTAPQRKGAGLGLAISKRLVEMMGGTIEAQSRRPGGTTVTVMLQGAARNDRQDAGGDGVVIEQASAAFISRPSVEEDDGAALGADVLESGNHFLEMESNHNEAPRFTYTDLVKPEDAQDADDPGNEAELDYSGNDAEAATIELIIENEESPPFDVDIEALYVSRDAEEDGDSFDDPGSSEEPEAIDVEGFQAEQESGGQKVDEFATEKGESQDPAGSALAEEPIEPVAVNEYSVPCESSAAEEPLQADPPEASAEPGMLSDGRASILVVEDNPDTRTLLDRILQKTYRVYAVSEARSALALMDQYNFDVLILDINLGGKETGVDVLRVARTLPGYDNVFAIALTAYALPGDRDRFLEAGFDKYVSKPFTRSTLMAALADGLAIPA